MLRMLTAFALLLSCTAGSAQTLLLGVSEGTSGGLDHAQVIAKYRGLAEVIGKAVHQKVEVVFAREFEALEEGMKSGRYDFVMARPSDYPARGLRDYGYRYVASTKPDGQCYVIVPKGSPIKTLAQARGKRFVMPEQISYMSKFCRAELRDKGIDLGKENVKFVREQGAVAFYLAHDFGDVGGLASYSSVTKQWEKDGNVVLHKSVTQPYFPLIAGKRIGEAQIGVIQKALRSLPGDESGQVVLKSIGVKEFDLDTEQRLRDLLKWLGV